MPGPEVDPVEVGPETAGALASVQAWGHAFNERDLDRLLAVSAPDIELATRNRAEHGHDAVRRLVHLQNYGVAQRVRARRYLARGSTLAVEAIVELRWVDSGELAETTHGVAVFDVHDGRVRRFRAHPDLDSALRAARWTAQAASIGSNFARATTTPN